MTTEKYTLEQCKADMLLLWGILKDNPYISTKERAIGLINDTKEIRRFNDMDNECPCCEYVKDFKNSCFHCPAWNVNVEGGCCEKKNGDDSEYEIWSSATDDETRQQAAQLIYDRALRIKV